LIRFVVKSAFWLFILLVGITLFVPAPDDEARQGQDYSAMDALIIVKGAITDLGGFCQRNEGTCEAGRSFFSSLGARARDGAGLLYQFLDRQFASDDTQPPEVAP